MSWHNVNGASSTKVPFSAPHIVPSGLSPGYPAIAGVKSERDSVSVVILAAVSHPTALPSSVVGILMTPQSKSGSPPLDIQPSGTHQSEAHSQPYGSSTASFPGMTATSDIQPSQTS